MKGIQSLFQPLRAFTWVWAYYARHDYRGVITKCFSSQRKYRTLYTVQRTSCVIKNTGFRLPLLMYFPDKMLLSLLLLEEYFMPTIYRDIHVNLPYPISLIIQDQAVSVLQP